MAAPPYDFQWQVLERLTSIEKAVGILATDGAVVKTKLSSLVEWIDDMDHDLNGNGRPGLKDRTTTLETLVAERTTTKVQNAGLIVSIAGVMAAGTQAIRELITRGGV